MAGEHEFILSLIGELDEGKTKANVQKALENVSKNVSLKSNSKAVKNAITVFDKEQLEKDGIAYLKSAKDIESQLSQMFKGIGTSFEVNKTFADDGSISKFVAKIYEGTMAIKTLNFEAAKFSDNTVGFRQVGGSAKSGKISTIEQETNAIKKENTEIDLQKELLLSLENIKSRLNNSSIIPDSTRVREMNEEIELLKKEIQSVDFSKITLSEKFNMDEMVKSISDAVIAEEKLHTIMQDKKTGIFNIPVLEKEGISFYDNTVGIVERVKQELEAKGYTPKISILSKTSEGEVTAFTAQIKNASGVVDNLTYSLVRLTDGEKTFDGFMSSAGKQIDNSAQEKQKTIEANVKAITSMGEKLRDFNSKYLNQDAKSRTTVVNETHFKRVSQLYSDLESRLEGYKGKVTEASTAEIKALDLVYNAMVREANEYGIIERNEENESKIAERDSEKKIQALENQRKLIALYNEDINKIKNSSLNSKSALALTNPDQISTITTLVDELDKRLTALRKGNERGKVIDPKWINDFIIALTQANNQINQFNAEQRKTDALDSTAGKVDVYKEKLRSFIQELQRDNLLTKEFRIEIGKLAQALYHVKTPEDLEKFKNDLSMLSEQAKRTRNDMQDSISGEQLQQKIRLLSAQVVGYMSQNTKAVGQFKSQFDALRNSINNITDANGLAKAQNEFKLLQQNINNAGQAGMTFGERMSAAVKKFLMWTGMTNSVMYLIRSIKQMITHTKELDSAMVSLKKVTDETESTYERIFDSATEKAKKLNTSIKNIIDSTAEFAKLGFSTEQAQELSEVANVYANVGELDIQNATESLVSTINGFKNLNANDAWKIIDEFNNVGNKFSISSAGIGEALKRSAASLSESNNSLEESIALVTTANSVIQDPEKVGTALRTMSLRIRGVKTELEQAGLETDGMIESTAKLRELVMAATGVDILEKDQKTFRSTYDILLDISKVWGTMNNELEKSSVLEALAGKLQSNILASILNNGEMLANVYDKAGKSENSAMQEQERWSESLEAKAGHIEAIFESISSKVFDSKSLKTIYDGLANILEIIEKIVDKGQGLTMLSGLAGGIMGGMGNGFINLKTTPGYWKETTKAISDYNNIAKSSATTANSFALSLSETNARLSEYLIAQNGATASTGGFIAATIKSTTATIANKVAITALNFAINAGIMVAITALVSLIGQWINKNKELTESLKDETDKLKSAIETLDDYKQKVQEIVDSEDSETEKLSKLYDIKKILADQYGIEIGHLNDVADARNKVIEGIDKQIKEERKLYVDNPKNKKAYELAKKRLNDGATTVGANDVGKFTISNITSLVGDDVRNLFDSVGKKKYSSVSTSQTYSIDRGKLDEKEYAELLKSKILQFDKIANSRKLTVDEQALFDSLYEQYDALNEKNKKYIENLDFAKAIAQNLIDSNPNASLSELWEKAGDDRYVKQALEEILFKEKEIVDEENKIATNPVLASLISDLSKINESISNITEKIQTANEQFEDLNKIIKDNEDTDKFFSSSEMIEILEKYPSLSNAIHETTYGYKIEANALEELRAAKLEEQKTALETELFETNARLESAKAKLLSYQNELDGVKDLASAKLKLAELETKLASIATNGQTTNPYYNTDVNALENQIGLYKDFIEANESAEKYKEQLEKLDIELQLLGKHHKDASDSKKDETDETNKLKEANKELTDEYKKAKDAIDDLLKLTMDMIMPKGKVRCYWKRWQANPFELLEYRKAIYTTT